MPPVDLPVDNPAKNVADFFSCTAGGLCSCRSRPVQAGLPAGCPQGIHRLRTALPQVLNRLSTRLVLARGPPVGRMSEPSVTGPLDSRRSSDPFGRTESTLGWGVTRGEEASGEHYRVAAARRGIRADAAARRRRRAVRARRHAAVQGRHLRRHRGDQAHRSLPAGPPARARGHPRPVRARRARRPDHRRQRAHQARRAHPHRRRSLPAHAHRVGAHRGQRRLLRADRQGARHPAAAGGGGHADRPVRLRRRRRRRRPGRPGPGRGVRGHRPPHRRGLPPAVRDHARRP